MRARFEVASESRVRIALDDAAARYPLVIDPLLAADSDALLRSDQAEADFGISVAGAGDVNGDGYGDLIVGARQYDAGQSNEGAAFVFLGGASAIADDPKTPADDAARLAREQADLAMVWLGKAVAAGYADTKHMKQDRDLDALSEREDFKQLLAELQARKK